MPRISTKGMAMPESPIRKLVPFAEAAEQEGRKVYYLNIGQPDIHTPQGALDAVKNAEIDTLAYSHSAGNESLRNGLAHYYRSHQIDVTTGDLLVTTGGSEALTFAFGSIMDAGDEIIIPEPFYANYNGFAIQTGVKVVPVEATIHNGFALPPIEDFEKHITDKTKAILICNPGNPTGYLYSEEELQQLAKLVLKYDLFLIADEVYREFVYDGVKHHSIMTLPDLEQHAIMIDSVSKRYSMCGARIGMLVSRNQNVMRTALKFAQARLSPPTYAQIATEGALDTPESYFTEVNDEYVKRRDILVDGLNSIDGVFCPKPQGAFYCVAQLPVDDADRFAQWLLQSFEHNNETVMIAPASGFYAKPSLGKRQARLAYVLNQESLQKCVELMRRALAEYPGGHI
ncbi:pyridoxal phosphate-dependent aminotransferase [Phaeocystidibacter marisrubri]|uniref:Aminotransferase n=1 Tax=Phaeocystidibacter marisrubri TaxID=1577780 RepID=A0A6L3ZIF1_9FLAO|nr:pyridoxal phosphate-dependent aminotransferase [Phaeocystidibacter marisrubri]KAB2817255.1 pyridoxal phosphate-dependent aminotransferase [Phaeocystidibacter marisrubri]